MSEHELILAYQGFAASIARDIHRKCPAGDLEEMLSDAILGLCKAAKTFKPELGFQFTTWAGKKIAFAVFDGLRTKNRTRTTRSRKPKFFSLDINNPRGHQNAFNGWVAKDEANLFDLTDQIEFVCRRLNLPAKCRELIRCMASGMSMTASARKVGVSDWTATMWMKAWRKEFARDCPEVAGVGNSAK